MKEITVIGSCVCRDLFEKDNGENYSFQTDIRFSSPISMLAEGVDSIKIDFDNFIKDVKTVNGKWYKKNLINDINKTAFSALKERHGEYLVLDLGESRISIAKIKCQNSDKELLVSNSVSFRAHLEASFRKNVFKNASIETINPLEFDDSFWKQTIKDFSKRILELFDEEKIILIKNMPAKYFADRNGKLRPYYSNDHFQIVAICELLLPKLYDYFIECCPKCKVIEMPEYAIGSQVHKWGNHPFHFTDTYYEYLLKCVNAIVLNNDYESVRKLFNDYSSLLENEFKKALMNTATNKSNAKFDTVDLLNQYEEFNHLGKKQKATILFALDKKHFFKNFNRIRKGK